MEINYTKKNFIVTQEKVRKFKNISTREIMADNEEEVKQMIERELSDIQNGVGYPDESRRGSVDTLLETSGKITIAEAK